MNVLIIGSGGREHALAWKAAQSPRVERVYVAPGNGGTALEPGVENVPIAPDDFPALIRFARDRSVDLTIVGPEQPLVAGIADAFADAGLALFGPSAAAARLEGSKAFTKAFLARHGVPTAAYATFADLEEALAYLEGCEPPIVVKADGLAAGKGVVVAQSLEEAAAAVREMLTGQAFGEAGRRVVVEEFLPGEEASFIALVDGETVLPLASSQDHKRLGDGDTGPNTGGMGAYSPAPVVTAEVHHRILEEIVRPTVRALVREGTPYRGFLYAGLMIGPDGAPRVIEYNCRLGDPEAQPILMRLRSDLVELVLAALEGRLAEVEADWDPRAALGVVLAAEGYPGRYRSGDLIHGLPSENLPDVKVFHAGTRLTEEGRLVTAGGRVLCVTALGETVTAAQKRAYHVAAGISWPGCYHRRDIGYRAVERERRLACQDE
ncbi:MAG: phosphoribosylamine--glycine ligase [Porticoccaceae bacterium]|nr:MAG: phosphoribosylamine--glycine ligase [Porticoccaceae bacterium]